MTPRRRRAALGFAAVAGVMLAVLSWLTVALLQLDTDEREARREAAVQERLRLALWRMDSWLAPQLAYESMRPTSDYAPFPSATAAWTKGFRRIAPDEVVVQSPLLGAQSPLFRLHFEFNDSGLCSPQAPLGNERDFAEANQIAPALLDDATARLDELRRRVTRERLEAAVGGVEARLPLLGCNLVAPESPLQLQQSVTEFNNRQMAVKTNVTPGDGNYIGQGTSWLAADSETVGPLVPVWIGDEDPLLVYARRVRRPSGSRIQGVLVDWATLEGELVGLVEDLFADCRVRLARCDEPTAAEQPTMLASVPARIVAHHRGVPLDSELPITAILWTTWGVTLLGLAALGFTLRAAIGFGERRAGFASAVTHELRTPLTTFRMYSEMLADDVVREPRARREYLQTLQRESNRLARVVENVLAWSRLEEGRFASRRERVAVGGLVERAAPTLTQRLDEVGMTLDVQLDDAARDLVVVTDEDAVGQVLFNLVDNAAKYACEAEDRTVTLHACRVGDAVHLTVRDRGPGVAPAHRERVFAPFDRGAVPGGSNDTPGVGLGLPLARGLARDLGGDLRLADDSGVGACFVLELPRS